MKAQVNFDALGGGGSGIQKVESGDKLCLSATGGSTGEVSTYGITAGKYKSAEYDVSGVSSVTLLYVSNGTYNATYGVLGYEVDGTETQITDYTNSQWKTKTVDLTSASTFNMWGNVVNNTAGARGLYGWMIFS